MSEIPLVLQRRELFLARGVYDVMGVLSPVFYGAEGVTQGAHYFGTRCYVSSSIFRTSSFLPLS